MTRITRSLMLCCLALAFLGCAGDNKAAKMKRAKAFKDLGSAMVRQDNPRGGLARLLEAVKLDPDDPDLHQQIALVYRNLGKYRLSREHFERSLALRPQSPEVWNNLGTLYLLEGKWDKAIKWFQKAADDVTYQTPQFAYNNMGLAYFNKGTVEKAVSSYEEALKLTPSYSPAYFNLGTAYEAMGKQEKAINTYKRAILHYPKYTAAHLTLGKLFLKLGKNKKAKEELNLTIWADPKGTEAGEARELLDKMSGE